MAESFNREKLTSRVDDSDMRAITEALKSDRVVDNKQKQALQDRANAFKNKNQQMQEEILRQE